MLPSKVREEKALADQRQRAFAGFGLMTLPGVPDAEGRPGSSRIPTTLAALARNPAAWASLLGDAMLRRGKGFRHLSSKRRPPKGAARWRGERRPDKVEEIAREAQATVERGKINFRRSAR